MVEVNTAKAYLDYLLERLRAERSDENLWLAVYLTGEYVEFLKEVYRGEEQTADEKNH
jgi:hypothetical protein